MNEDELREHFSPLLDGELSPSERAEVEKQLAQDADALRELEGFKRVDALYRGLPKLSTPEGFEDRVQEAVKKPRVVQFRKRHERRSVWPLVAAAALFIVVVGGFLYQYALLRGTPPTLQVAARESMEKDALIASRARPKDEGQTMADALAESPRVAGERTEAEGAENLAFGAPARRRTLAMPTTSPEEAEVSSDALPAETTPAPAAKPEEGYSYGGGYGGYAMRAGAAPSAQPGDVKGVLDQALPPSPQAPPAAIPPPQAAQLGAQVSEQVDEFHELAAAPEKEAMAKEEAVTGIFFAAKAREEAATRKLGDRVFQLQDGVWRQEGYAGETAASLRRDSQALQDLIRRHPEFSPLTTWEEAVVFHEDDTWYRLDPAQ